MTRMLDDNDCTLAHTRTHFCIFNDPFIPTQCVFMLCSSIYLYLFLFCCFLFISDVCVHIVILTVLMCYVVVFERINKYVLFFNCVHVIVCAYACSGFVYSEMAQANSCKN
eukprot:m.41727 g.41727  ORF g.41727 m.41727 type:complete len:111 (+) comp10452_c0_seq3:665-997(+)